MNTKKPFYPNCKPVLIGSFPIQDHREALDLVAAHTPEIPLWAQLPANPGEGMVAQFAPGLPGLVEKDGKIILDTGCRSFEDKLMEFYEEYISVTDGGEPLDLSRFALTPLQAPGFFALIERLDDWPCAPGALKAQITGPFTLGTMLVDQEGRAAFYDDRLRDCVVKIVAQKAKWQVQQLSAFNCPVMLFFDEPALAGFGSSAFISVSKDDIAACFAEVIEAVHDAGGLSGVHICANSDWSLVLDSSVDIISFDAYMVFEQFVMYGEKLKAFFESGRIVAWGIVPTSDSKAIQAETPESLETRWQNNMKAVQALGVDRDRLFAQSLITPACGTGSLDMKSTLKVLELTRDVSNIIRNKE